MAVALGTTGEGRQYNGRTTLLVVLSCVVAASGGLIFGYDLGVSGGVTSMDSFLKKFFPDVFRRMKGTKISNYCRYDNQLLTLFTSSLYLSGCISSLFASAVTRTFGRKASMFVAGIAVLSGSALGGAASNVYMLVFGRVFLGIGLGFGNQSIPLYISEMALPERRGAISFIFDIGIGFGILIANTINFFIENIEGGWGWRISLSMAAVPATILTLGAILLPETPNCLILQDSNNHEKAKHVLQRIRGTNDVEAELDDLIKASLISKTTKHPFKKIIQKKYRPQLVMAIAIPIFSQLTGITIITFYAPILFRTIGLHESASLLSAVLIRIVSTSCIFISMFLVDKHGRRVLFIIGGIIMLAMQVTIGGVMAALLGDHGALSNLNAYVVLVLICIYISGFGLSWGPLAWLIPSEIYSLEIRSAGQSITVAIHFFFNFLIGQMFLTLLCHMKYGIFFFFGGWLALMTIFVYYFLPETKNVPIEKMEKIWKEHWFWRNIVGDDQVEDKGYKP